MAAGAVELVVGMSSGCGTRARLTLAAPLPVDVEVGAELGRGLPSRRRSLVRRDVAPCPHRDG
ncbi:hypothetical protein MXD62_05785 [Frankia sp. Mgl5]|uniref:hypothetical protein n=1 Tax=Frankia sp. Mgl5 TaxID=2933793 RepID=UPI00200C9232|nr:hypothetical protein [Frankia sp. Mgl5]MCK9926683.1 hypothetical protein [Frankia sp. Mgl5]